MASETRWKFEEKKKKSLEAAVTELNTSVDTYAEKAEASTSDIMWVIQFEEDS